MGFGDLFKGLLGGSPGRVDYRELADDDLLRLSTSRGTLTEEARRALDEELDRRNLKAAPARDPVEEEDEDDRPLAPAIEGDPILVLERRGVVLRTQANASLLVLMPLWDGTAPFTVERREMKSNVAELVVLNEEEGGFLPTAYVAERLTVRNDRIFALAPDLPADRPLPGLSVERAVAAETFRDRLEIGNLILERTDFLDVVIATWRTTDLAVAIGPHIPAAFFREHEGISHVIGGLLPPQTEEERAIYADPELYQTLEMVILLLDHAGVSSWPVTLLPALGVTVQAVGREEGSEGDELAVQMKQAVDAGAWEKAAELFEDLSAREIEDVVDGLAIEGNLEGARRVLALALASSDWKDSGRMHFLDGAIRFMGQDVEGAMASYTKALEGEEPDARAYANLSAIHRKRRDYGEAIRCAEKALEAMPGDAISTVNLLAALASAGRSGEAKSLIDRSEQVLGSAGVLEWHARLSSWSMIEEGPDELPHLADKAYQIGCIYASSNRLPEALRMFQRSVELMPSHLEAVLELGVMLSSSGRDEEAIALYDGVLSRAPGIAFVRFNRANCLVRLERMEEAIEELRRVAREVPEWEAPGEALKALASAGYGSGS
jgi:tetratricopeptide (TPR) repeat protein